MTRNGMKVLLLLSLLASPLAARAIPLGNLDDHARRTGQVANFFFGERLWYDADADRLSYSVSGPFSYSNRLICGFPCEAQSVQFDGIFSWTAGVEEHGSITDPGSMLWLGNFGSGYEVLASGQLRGIGSQHVNPDFFPDYGIYIFGNLQFLFDIDFLDERITRMGDQMLLLFEQELTTPFETPFYQDFECGFGMETHYPALPRCSSYSTSGVVGLNVSEPGTLALLGIGLAWLGFVRVGAARNRRFSRRPSR